MSIPNYSAELRDIFESFPADVALLNRLCDQCEADRAAFGEDDSRVQEGEFKVNNMKGQFTRRFAWAAYQHDKRFGLRRKTAGAIATRRDGVAHSTDVLMLRDNGQIIDVMSDRHPTWSVADGDTQPVDQWVQPIPEDASAPVPVPVPVPDTPPVVVDPPAPVEEEVTHMDLLNLLDALHRDYQELAGVVRTLLARGTPVMPKSFVGKIPYFGPITLTPQY